jgi:hypothetical protein
MRCNKCGKELSITKMIELNTDITAMCLYESKKVRDKIFKENIPWDRMYLCKDCFEKFKKFMTEG